MTRNLDKPVPAELVSPLAGRRKPMTLASIVCQVLSSIVKKIIMVFFLKNLPILREHLYIALSLSHSLSLHSLI
jgi:hypothetical protein